MRIKKADRGRGVSLSFLTLRSCKLANLMIYYLYYGFLCSDLHRNERELVYKAGQDGRVPCLKARILYGSGPDKD